MNLWDEIINVASFMLIAAVAGVIVYGIIVPAMNAAPFGQDSLKRHPKLQYTGLVVLSIALDTNTLFGGWVNTAGDWLETGGAVFAGMTAGQSMAGIAGAVLLMLWTVVMLPNKVEPTNLGVIGHFIMWGVSLLAYPLTGASIGVSALIAMAIILGIAAVANLKGGARQGAFA